jgi:hypothetical protein
VSRCHLPLGAIKRPKLVASPNVDHDMLSSFETLLPLLGKVLPKSSEWRCVSIAELLNVAEIRKPVSAFNKLNPLDMAVLSGTKQQLRFIYHSTAKCQ